MAQSLLSGITSANAEARYQAFYPACAEGRVEVEQALVQIDELYRTADEPTLTSYCLIYYSAVVDTNTLSRATLLRLSQRLAALLAGLSDFRVKDNEGHYVHFMSHATYLAHSIHDAGGRIGWEPLLAAYLRADEAFRWNEDIVLADCLLDIAPPKDFATLLAQLTKGKSEGPHASNKRALWLAMRLLNEQKPRHNTAAFAGLVGELVTMVT